MSFLSNQILVDLRFHISPTDLQNLPDQKSYDIFNLI